MKTKSLLPPRGSLIEVNALRLTPREPSRRQVLAIILIGATILGNFIPGAIHLGFKIFDGPVLPIPVFDWWWMWIK